MSAAWVQYRRHAFGSRCRYSRIPGQQLHRREPLVFGDVVASLVRGNSVKLAFSLQAELRPLWDVGAVVHQVVEVDEIVRSEAVHRRDTIASVTTLCGISFACAGCRRSRNRSRSVYCFQIALARCRRRNSHLLERYTYTYEEDVRVGSPIDV